MSKTILVVDDSQFVLDMTRFMLDSAGFTTLTASAGLEALEILARDPVDLVIVDINMPGMDGYTLTSKIREDAAFGEVPIMIVTTESEARDMQKGFEAGANAYLVKPVSADELAARIGLLIGEP
jgi:two-component system chemotaxis response regulator CheY